MLPSTINSKRGTAIQAAKTNFDTNEGGVEIDTSQTSYAIFVSGQLFNASDTPLAGIAAELGSGNP